MQPKQDELWFSFQGACIRVIASPMANSFLNSDIYSTVIFVHGRFGQAEMWEPMMSALKHQALCISVDLPGFGHSFSAKDRPFSLMEDVRLLDQLIYRFSAPGQSVTLVGHDIGGSIAQLCAIRNTKRVSAVVLMNASVPHVPFKRKRIGAFSWLARWRLNQMLSRAANVGPFYKDILLSPWEQSSSRKSTFQACRVLEDSLITTGLETNFTQNLAQPVLLLWGARDNLNSPQIGVELMKKLSDSNFYVHEQAGHWPHLEQPEWVISKMRELIFKTRQVPLNVQKFLSK